MLKYDRQTQAAYSRPFAERRKYLSDAITKQTPDFASVMNTFFPKLSHKSQQSNTDSTRESKKK